MKLCEVEGMSTVLMEFSPADDSAEKNEERERNEEKRKKKNLGGVIWLRINPLPLDGKSEDKTTSYWD